MKVESPEVLEQERPLTIEEKAKLFPLSYWMRLGAKKRSQCFRDFTDGVGTCAIGAALDGVGALSIPREIFFNIYCDIFGRGTFFWLGLGWLLGPKSQFEIFPQLKDKVEGSVSDLATDIVTLNDVRVMTREEIADWLESRGY